MTVISKIQKVSSIPIKISFNKLSEKLLAILNNNKKLAYIDDISFENNIINPNNNLNINLLNNISDKINYEIIENIINHQFNLLGSSDIIVSHRTRAKGFENILYKNNLKNFYLLSDACNYLLLDKYKSNAIKIIELISPDYNLIDWQLDFRSGYRWSEKVESNKIKIGNVKGADIKVPWELARFQHLPLLALFYSQNPDLETVKAEKLINEFCDEILDFIAFNPLNYGVHWKVAMEVSIRVSNIILAYQIFKSCKVQFSSSFENLLFNFIEKSLQFINNHREWSGGLRGNHYFSNISSILYTSCFLGTDKYEDIVKFAVNEIINETLQQFRYDGGNFENSFSYHLFTVELLLWDLYIIGLAEPDILTKHKQYNEFQDRIEKILEFTYQMLGKDNFIPQIGDNDSGYFLGLCPDANSLKNINLLLHLISNHNFPISMYDKIRQSNLLNSDLNNVDELEQEKQILFQESGMFIFENSNYKVWIILGSKAQFGKGGHNHQDTTSFILQIGNRPVIVDPGTYVYTAFPELRNLFRSYFYHNSYSPKDYKLVTNEIEDLFWLKSELCKYSVNKNSLQLERKIDGAKHIRNFQFSESSIEINDKFNHKPSGILLLHLDPTISIEKKSNNELILLNNQKQIINISSNNQISLDKYKYSSEYGKSIDSNVIIINNLTINNKIKIEVINGTPSK
jgi:hypothetical protein